MDLGLRGKVALVTGASKGIGRAIALGLAREGASVAISARTQRDLDEAAEAIRAAGGTALGIRADATSAADTARLVETTVAQLGGIHVLVNNAGGIGRFAPFEALADADWDELWALNVLSAVRATRAALPHMRRQRWGRIINLASESGSQPDAEMAHYNATKAALINFTKSLSKAYGGEGILVNTVSPAFIRTPLVEAMLAEQAAQQGITLAEAERAFLRQQRPNIVLGRAGTAEETAAAVLFLASEAASFITGANYRVDGGSVASV